MAICVGLGAAAMAGCGSSGSSTSGSTSASGTTSSALGQAQASLDQLRAPVKFKPPDPSFNVGNSLGGKMIYWISDGLQYPFNQAIEAGEKEAAKMLGINVVVVDSHSQIGPAGGLIDQAVSRKAAAIILESIPSQALSAPLKAAARAGVPVIEQTAGDPELPPASLKRLGVKGIVSYCYTCGAKQMADVVATDSGGKADTVVVGAPDISTSAPMEKAFQQEYSRVCQGCELATKQVPVEQWSTQLPSVTSSALRSDPKVNYLVPLYDALEPLMGPSVARAGKANSVKFVSFNATLPVMQALQRKDMVQADIGSPQAWLGWATIDQTARILSGKPAVASENIPNRLFDQTNIGSIDLKKPEETWYGTADFRAGYRRLWGTG